jgi:hypothetical protein
MMNNPARIKYSQIAGEYHHETDRLCLGELLSAAFGLSIGIFHQ